MKQLAKTFFLIALAGLIITIVSTSGCEHNVWTRMKKTEIELPKPLAFTEPFSPDVVSTVAKCQNAIAQPFRQRNQATLELPALAFIRRDYSFDEVNNPKGKWMQTAFMFGDANSLDEAKTLVCIDEVSQYAGCYSQYMFGSCTGAKAFRLNWRVLVLQAKDGKILSDSRFLGNDPPKEKIADHTPVIYGKVPVYEAFEWLQKLLPKQNSMVIGRTKFLNSAFTYSPKTDTAVLSNYEFWENIESVILRSNSTNTESISTTWKTMEKIPSQTSSNNLYYVGNFIIDFDGSPTFYATKSIVEPDWVGQRPYRIDGFVKRGGVKINQFLLSTLSYNAEDRTRLVKWSPLDGSNVEITNYGKTNTCLGDCYDISSDGKLGAVIGWGPYVYIINLSKDTQEKKLRTTSDLLTSVAFSPDGRYIAAGSSKGEVWVWETTNYDGVAFFQAHSGKVDKIIFQQSGEIITSSNSEGECPKTFYGYAYDNGPAKSRMVAHHSQIFRWSLPQIKLVQVIHNSCSNKIEEMALSADSQKLVVVKSNNYYQNTIVQWISLSP